MHVSACSLFMKRGGNNDHDELIVVSKVTLNDKTKQKIK